MNLLDSLNVADSDRDALVVGDSSVSYGDLTTRAAQWRGRLVAQGLTVGDHVAVLAGNSIDFVLAHLACVGAGLVLVPLNPQAPQPELVAELAAVDPNAMIVGPVGADAYAALRGSGVAPPIAFATTDALCAAGCIDLNSPGPEAEVVSVEADHPAALLFTSGTAGPPKPAILTHGNMASSIAAIRALPLDFETNSHTLLAIIPLFHVFGLNVILNFGLSIGATLVLGDFEGPDQAAATIRARGVTIMAGPPALWASFLGSNAEARDFTSVQLALSGASKLDGRVAEALRERFGLDVREGYGLTESSGILTSAMGTSAPRGSVGQMLPGVELRIVDQAGSDVLVGDSGEVLARGPMISPGYWNDVDATERVRDDEGWLRTGDLAIVDENGFISIVDRLKDLIIVSGFNVHPVEVEAALQSHDEVLLAAAVGEPGDAGEESVVAYVILRPHASLDEAALMEHCRGRLARYKVPRRIAIVDAIPTTAVGKIRRRDLGA